MLIYKQQLIVPHTLSANICSQLIPFLNTIRFSIKTRSELNALYPSLPLSLPLSHCQPTFLLLKIKRKQRKETRKKACEITVFFSTYMRMIACVHVRSCSFVGERTCVFESPFFKILEQVTNFHETWSESYATDDNPQTPNFL